MRRECMLWENLTGGMSASVFRIATCLLVHATGILKNFFISLLFHLFFLILTCSCPYSYNLKPVLTATHMFRPYIYVLNIRTDPIPYNMTISVNYYIFFPLKKHDSSFAIAS